MDILTTINSPINIYKLPIPFINRIFGRPLTSDFRTNCLLGDHPRHHKDSDSESNPDGWADGDIHPSLRFSWRPPINYKERLSSPIQDLRSIFEESNSSNKFSCHCGLKGDVIDFTRYLLSPKRKKPYDELNMVTVDESKRYLTYIANHINEYRRYTVLLPDALSETIWGSQYSGLYHIARYVGCKNASDVPECYIYLNRLLGIDRALLARLEVGYVFDDKMFKDAFIKDNRFKNNNDLISSGLFNNSGLPAFEKGTVVFPFKRGGTIIHLFGWNQFESREPFISSSYPLYEEDTVLGSGGIRPVIVCDNLPDTLLFINAGYLAVGVPWCSHFNSSQAEPFREAQMVLRHSKGLNVILAFNPWAYGFESTKMFLSHLCSIKKIGMKISRLKLPHGIRHIRDFFNKNSSVMDLNIQLTDPGLLEDHDA